MANKFNTHVKCYGHLSKTFLINSMSTEEERESTSHGHLCYACSAIVANQLGGRMNWHRIGIDRNIKWTLRYFLFVILLLVVQH